ncbi:hypothetical protein OROMI_020333 [Orobanche minor]
MAGFWSDHFPAAVKTPETISPCKTKGTWSQLFSSAEKTPSPTPPPPLGRYQRCLLCRTCNASCRLFTSNTPQNPNRQFYKCAAFDHKFFKWADEAKPDEFIDVPSCGGCSAGICRVRKEKSGPNAVGEGSCGYRAWQDELAKSADERMTSSKSPTINGDSTRPSNNDLVKENRQSNERAHNDSPVTDTLSRKSEHLNYQENNHDESWRRAQKIPYERVTSLQSPSHAVSNAHTKRANTDLVEESSQSNRGVGNVSPEIETWQHLNCHGVTSRKTEHLCEENQPNESTRRARRLSDVRITLFQSPTVDGDHTMPANSDLVEQNSQSNEGAVSESPVIDTLECNHGLGVTSRKTVQSKCLENQNNESSPRRPHKRSRQGGFKAPSTLVSSQSLTLDPTMDSVLVKHCWMVAAIRQNLSSQLQGWWGRLAFHPMPCLMTHASKSLDCYVSSPRDSTFTVQDEILVKSSNLTTLTRILLGVESYDKPLLNRGQDTRLSGTKPFRVALDASLPRQPSTDTNVRNVMSESISKAFGRAAEHLRNDFLSLLNKMDVEDYEAMSREAEATFTALDRLLFNYRDFEGRTKEYIQCAASLAEIERSMPGDESYQKLIEHCSSERMRLDEINSVHAEAVDSVSRSKKRLKSLQDEVSSTMDWLFQIEAELSCCEVEMGNMERELEKICRNKEVLEEKYMIAAKELQRSKMVFERKEAERDAAKAAFGRAREMLRGIE